MLQHIIGAEFNDHEIRIVLERLVDAGISRAAGATGLGTVPDDDVIAVGQKLALEL